MKILITGGLGYIGGRIAEFLLKNNYKVIITSHRFKPKIPDCLIKCEVRYIDMEDVNSIDNVCKDIDTIIHLAGLNAQDCQNNRKLGLFINGLGTYNIIKSAEKSNVYNFIYISTIHVYGNLEGDISEIKTTCPIHPYGISKNLAESFLFEAKNNNKIKNITILRLSNAFGSPISDDVNCWDLVINDIVKNIIYTNKMAFNSSIDNKRDFITIEDVCRAITFFIEKKICGVFNLSTGKTINLGELSRIISNRVSRFNIKPQISFKKKICVKDYKINNKKLLKTGFILNNNIEEEIDQLIKNSIVWFK